MADAYGPRFRISDQQRNLFGAWDRMLYCSSYRGNLLSTVQPVGKQGHHDASHGLRGCVQQELLHVDNLLYRRAVPGAVLARRAAGQEGRGQMPPCQAQENWTSPPISPKIKGNPGPCGNRNRGWHGAVCAPVHDYLLNQTFFGPVSAATDTGPALFKAGNRHAGAGRRVPAARQAVVSCGTPSKDLRRARRKKRWG